MQAWNEDRLGWLALAWFEHFSARSLRRLRARFPNDGARAVAASREELLSLGITEKTTNAFVSWRPHVEAEMLARRCDGEGIRLVLDDDDEFPDYLKHSADPPAALFVRGARLELKQPIAVVGTRSMTHYGSKVTEKLCTDLVYGGCEIVSGLAFGVDAKAHEVTLASQGITVAVLAGGCNDEALYPRTNLRLAKQILESGGTILSESAPGTDSFRYLFPLRNRLIASLSVATVVVEAAEKSGSLITAKLALEENRDVFAVPGPITSEQSAGTNQLLKLGAIPCLGAQEVLELFHVQGRAVEAMPIHASDEERELLETLNQPLHVDDLIRAVEREPRAVASVLAAMEVKGLVEQQGGGFYLRTVRGRIAAGLT